MLDGEPYAAAGWHDTLARRGGGLVDTEVGEPLMAAADTSKAAVSIAEERRRVNDEAAAFDELGRDTYLLGLLEVVSQADPPLVVGVHGDWGTGKTSFMRVLRNLVDKKKRAEYGAAEGKDGIPEPERLATRAGAKLALQLKQDDPHIPTVWFNPWEHQFEDEPVMPLLDAIRHQQKSLWDKIESGIKKVVEDPKFRIMGKAALGVARMIGPGWFSALSRQIGDEARSVMESFSQFRDEFEQCMRELTKNEGGRLVIFLDDLDRCEADYVVKILEALKLHLLNRYCVFVLGCAHERVSQCLQTKLEIDADAAEEYLDKIIQLPVHLPVVLDAQLDGLLEQLGWTQFTRGEDPRCFALLKALAGDNPRRLKRFLYWYRMERAMVESVPGLSREADEFFSDEAVFLKIKILQFLEPYGFVDAESFRARDRAPEDQGEARSEGADGG